MLSGTNYHSFSQFHRPSKVTTNYLKNKQAPNSMRPYSSFSSHRNQLTFDHQSNREFPVLLNERISNSRSLQSSWGVSEPFRVPHTERKW